MAAEYSALDISYIFIQLYNSSEKTGISLKKLEILCFLVQSWKVAQEGKPFFKDAIYVAKDRPIIPSLENAYCETRDSIEKPVPSFAKEESFEESGGLANDSFSKEDLSLLMKVFSYYSKASEEDLLRMFAEDDSRWKKLLAKEGEPLTKEDFELFWED